MGSPSKQTKQLDDLGKDDTNKPPVELYLVRLSPACRAVRLYMLQHNIPHVLIDVDFENNETSEIAKFQHKEVPIIVDGDVTVFEGPIILRYLAMQYTDFAGFGFTLQTRMLVDSLISWANSEIHRTVGYSYAYPNFLEKYRLATDKSNEELMDHGIKSLVKQLECLEIGYLAKKKFLTGDRLTVADSYVATTLIQAEWVGFKFQMWPKIENWLRRVKSQEYWAEVHITHRDLIRESEQVPFQFE